MVRSRCIRMHANLQCTACEKNVRSPWRGTKVAPCRALPSRLGIRRAGRDCDAPSGFPLQTSRRGHGARPRSRLGEQQRLSSATQEGAEPSHKGSAPKARGDRCCRGRRLGAREARCHNRRRKVRSLSGSLNRCIQGLVHFSRLPRLYSFLQRSAVPPLSGWFYLRRPERGGYDETLIRCDKS